MVLRVTIRVKSEHVREFLEVARYDAEHSEKDEPGCLRFDVIQDRDDLGRFYVYEYGKIGDVVDYVDKPSALLRTLYQGTLQCRSSCVGRVRYPAPCPPGCPNPPRANVVSVI